MLNPPDQPVRITDSVGLDVYESRVRVLLWLYILYIRISAYYTYVQLILSNAFEVLM
jgi:hypothetical protein